MTRLLVGCVFVVVAISLALIGFVRLITTLENDGYGTPDMRNALIILGVSGACLATGVATVIWDISKRYENR